MCKECGMHTPDVKSRNMSTKIDTSQNNFLQTKSDDTKVTVFYTTLNKLINSIDSRFKKESINYSQIINSIKNIVKLKNTGKNVSYKCLIICGFK